MPASKMTLPEQETAHPTDRVTSDLLPAIAPIFRIDLSCATLHLVGTGFWLTKDGHLLTARHVIDENIGPDGADLGPIFAVQTLPDRSIHVRHFVKTDKHPQFDLALSETSALPGQPRRATFPIPLTLDEPGIGQPVFSFAVLSVDQSFSGEERPGLTSAVFSGELWMEQVGKLPISFAVRRNVGYVADIFHEMRDKVMLPFPCLQTDVMIYGGNSGGPLLDAYGRVCAVHCSSYEGTSIAFHVPVRGILPLRLRRRTGFLRSSSLITAGELAMKGVLKLDPPAFSREYLVRSILRWGWHWLTCSLKKKPLGALHFLQWEARQRPPRGNNG